MVRDGVTGESSPTSTRGGKEKDYPNNPKTPIPQPSHHGGGKPWDSKLQEEHIDY